MYQIYPRSFLDTNGDGIGDSPSVLASLGVDESERRSLGSAYPAGKTLWRTVRTHFSSVDCNLAMYYPQDAADPVGPVTTEESEDRPTCTSGSIPTRASGGSISCFSRGSPLACTGSWSRIPMRNGP